MREYLEEMGFRVADFRGSRASVDIVARRGEEVLVIKILGNAEALKQHHANDMKKLAYVLEGKPVVITERSRYGRLQSGVVYRKYGVAVVNGETFKYMVEGGELALYKKGKKVVRINGEELRKRRVERGLSLQALARLVGTTKETIYRYERGQSASLEMARRLEEILGPGLIAEEPLSIEIDVSLPYPFTILSHLCERAAHFARMPWSVLSRGSTTISFVKRGTNIKDLEEGRGKVYEYYLFVGKVRGKPYIEEEELLSAESFREIEEIARERNEEVADREA